MRRTRVFGILITAATVIVVGAATPGVAQTSTAKTPEPTTVEQLFVQNADSGTLTPVKGSGGVYSLQLHGVTPRVITFTDSPLRVASSLGIENFLTSWEDGTFADDPPNAALVLADAPPDADTFIFQLTDPTYDKKNQSLRYRATVVHEKPTGRLANFADQVDDKPPTSFKRASLFIDALPSTEMTVTVSGIPTAGVGGFITHGYTSVLESQTVQGEVTDVFGPKNGVVVTTSAAQQGTAKVVLTISYCVAPGTTSVPIDVSGNSPGVTLEFNLGGPVQAFTASGTLQVPAKYQLTGCNH